MGSSRNARVFKSPLLKKGGRLFEGEVSRGEHVQRSRHRIANYNIFKRDKSDQ